MNNISLKLSQRQIKDLVTKYKDQICPSPSDYIDYFIKTADGTTISIYATGKVLLQGENAHFHVVDTIRQNKAQAGSDEVGTGDYFGPVCVCACIIEETDYTLFEDIKIGDSKAIDDAYILEIGDVLMKKLKHSLLILEPSKYNEVHKKYNLNAIKAIMHNQAYINLQHKGYKLPSACYVDQFVAKDAYFKHLTDQKEVYHNLQFATKAESKYLSVATASIIARYAFLRQMQAMNAHYGMDFPLGARPIVTKTAANFIKKYGKERLKEVAKLHFKNTEQISSYL